MKRAGLIVLALASSACGPGPVVYLGRAPARDAGTDAQVDAAMEERDSGRDEGDEDDDDRPLPCINEAQCDDERPFCDGDRLRCVECLEDDDCERGDHCDEGDCDDRD